MNTQGDILLVEDNQADMQLTLHVLSSYGIQQVQVARDGEQALKLIFGEEQSLTEQHTKVFAMVLLDLKLPKVDGTEVLKALKTSPTTKAMPVVVFSSSKQVSDVDVCYLLGANGYVQKPVDFEEFESTVRRIADYWISVNLIASPAAFTPMEDDTGLLQ